MKPIKLKINTNSENYPIIIGTNLVAKFSNFIKKNSIKFEKCLLVIDKNVPQRKITQLKQSLRSKKISIHSFNANEKNKNQKNLDTILKVLLEKNFSRQDCLISIGGGITGDVSGFAASIYKRGIQFINIPTTLLSQVDSSVGGKTGINTTHGKNLVGNFYQPKLVLSDSDFLKSLPKREIICGYGEIFKHSLISNKKFYQFLDKNIFKILNIKSPFIEKAIYESCKIKKTIVEKDEKEKSSKFRTYFCSRL
jgi:3-dehydroquinate synthetase